jgi:ABC-type transporter Mla subunit MlaD
MDLTTQRFRLGLFVVVAAIILAVMSVFFGGSPRLFQARDRYVIVFDDAPGVVPGTPVRKSGVRIGEVESVELDDANGTVRVHIAVDKKYRLRKDEEPLIVPDLLSRDTTIDFVPLPPKTPPPPVPRAEAVVPARFVQAQPEKGLDPPPGPALPGEPIPPGAEIRGRSPPDVRAMLREATDVLPTAQMSLAQIRKSLERFDRIAPLVEDTLREYAELARSVREAVPELRRTNDDVRAAVAGFKDIGPEAKRALEEVQGFSRQYSRLGERLDVLLQTNADVIDRTVKNVETITRQAAGLLSEENVRNVTASLRSVQSLSKTADEIAVQAKRETIPRFTETLGRVDSVLLNVNQAVKPLADRSDRIARNLDAAIENLARTIGGFSDVLGPAAGADGSVRRLFTDPALFNNLNDASLMLTRILPRVDRILKDVEVFADKIARHPESLGVGGVVRPSAGLKDAPPGASLRPHH